MAIDVRRRIGLSVAKLLRLDQHRLKSGFALLDLGQDEVAGAIQNSVEFHYTITGDSFTQDRVDRDTAGDTSLHGKIDTILNSKAPEIGPALSHQLFVGRHHRFAASKSLLNHVTRSCCATYDFYYNIDLWGLKLLDANRLFAVVNRARCSALFDAHCGCTQS